MKLCGCLTGRDDVQDEQPKKCLKRDLSASNGGSSISKKLHKERTKSNTSGIRQSGCSTSKNQSTSGSIHKVILRENCHDVSNRRSVTFANDSETEQRKFLRLNKAKCGSIHELQFNENKRVKSSPNVNRSINNTSYETTTCDELENSQQKKTAIRRRKRSKSPRKQLPSEILDAIKFDLVESANLDENQLKNIPYENIKTSTQPVRISISSYSSQHRQRRRRSSAFNRSGGVVHSASSHMLNYQIQPPIVCIAQIKSTSIQIPKI